MPLHFIIKTSKVLVRLNAFFFEGLQPQNVPLIVFLFSKKYSYLLVAKITPDVNNSLYFYMVERATIGNSLHVKQKCSLNWIDVVCICHAILLEVNFTRNINFCVRNINFCVWIAQHHNVLNLLFNFQSRYSWKILIKKFMVELMKALN